MPSSAASNSNSKATNMAGAATQATLECNYEKNCPPFFEAIESDENPNDFYRIHKFLTTGKWEGAQRLLVPWSSPRLRRNVARG
jgi:hypothetical protein